MKGRGNRERLSGHNLEITSLRTGVGILTVVGWLQRELPCLRLDLTSSLKPMSHGLIVSKYDPSAGHIHLPSLLLESQRKNLWYHEIIPPTTTTKTKQTNKNQLARKESSRGQRSVILFCNLIERTGVTNSISSFTFASLWPWTSHCSLWDPWFPSW